MRRTVSFYSRLCCALACSALSFSSVANIIETQSLAGFGTPKYKDDFTHFDYVNPNAPKVGQATFAALGTFDNFNRYASRGVSGAQTDSLYDPLMWQASDEVDSYYPLIAERIKYSDGYDWAEIRINPKAKFQDGKPITADDVAFTFDKFMKEGVPQYRIYYKDIKSVKAIDALTVRIEMASPNREKLFSFIETTRVLPKHFWQDKNLAEPLSTPPVGSGPYKIIDYKMGQSITYALDPNYWAKDLPVNVGRNNFEKMIYDYYRDDTVMLEAFKAGEFDFRRESSANFWATSYTGKNFDKKFIKKEEIINKEPASAQGFIFNTQKPIFSDPKVREAISYMMDFEWMNKNMFYSQYLRNRSYFENTVYAAKGLPSAEEIKLLSPYKDKLPTRLFTSEFNPPNTDGTGNIRPQMRKAIRLLKSAGWSLKNQVMTKDKTGEAFVFNLLIYSPVTERIAIPFQRNLAKIGIKMNIRSVDTSQYIKRYQDRDFDMVSSSFAANPFPNPNLLIVWNSHYIKSTYNTAGVNNAVVDALTDAIAKNQSDPQKLITLGHALDRVLQWNFYMVPQWYSNIYRIATWDKFERPSLMPTYDLGLDTWWISTQKADKLPKKNQPTQSQ